MKCWECKRQDIEYVRRVFYYDIVHDILMPRDICYLCLPKLKLNKMHHVEVDNIRKTSIKNGRAREQENTSRGVERA